MSSKMKLKRYNGVWFNWMENYTYSVVQFIQRPNQSIPKYVCVPSSWIKTRRESDHKVGVLYPDEDKVIIDKLVEKNQKIKPSMQAREYLCELLYSVNEYSAAKIFIMIKSTKDHEKKGRSTSVKNAASEKEALKLTLNAVPAENQCSPAQSETPRKNNNLKRRRSVCIPKNCENVPKPATLSMTSNSLAYLRDIGELVKNLGQVIQRFVDSFEECVTENMEDSQMQDDENIEPCGDVANARKKRIISFELPPEYDEKDTRWTLKYREPGENIIELMPDSKVYVKDYELALCLKNSQNAIQLTKYLLVAIFNENALKTCSITGCKAYGHKAEEIRPPLDREAKDEMLKFITLYGAEEKWEPMTERALNMAIRNKLNEVRRKEQHKSKVVPEQISEQDRTDQTS